MRNVISLGAIESGAHLQMCDWKGGSCYRRSLVGQRFVQAEDTGQQNKTARLWEENRDKQTYKQTKKQTGRQTCKQTDSYIGRLADRKAKHAD